MHYRQKAQQTYVENLEKQLDKLIEEVKTLKLQITFKDERISELMSENNVLVKHQNEILFQNNKMLSELERYRKQ